MAAQLPFVSVIVPTRNEEKVIADCLDSILKVNYPKNKFEVIVSDGKSTDKTREIVKKYKKVKLLDNQGVNSAAGRNLGVKKAKGDIVAFTDADCTVAKNWLKALVKELDPNTVVGGANLPPKNDKYFPSAVSYALGTFLGSAGSAQSYVHSEKKEVSSVPNANAMYWKKDIQKVGGYNEEFVTGQDAELNYRLSQTGIKFMFIPSAKIWHKMRATPRKFAKRMYQYGSARANLLKLHKSGLNPLLLFAPLFALFVLTFPIIYLSFPIYAYLWLPYLAVIFLFALSTFKLIHLPAIMFVFVLEHLFYGIGFIVGYFSK